MQPKYHIQKTSFNSPIIAIMVNKTHKEKEDTKSNIRRRKKRFGIFKKKSEE